MLRNKKFEVNLATESDPYFRYGSHRYFRYRVSRVINRACANSRYTVSTGTGAERTIKRAAGNKSISKQNTFIVHLCLGGYCKVEARALVRY